MDTCKLVAATSLASFALGIFWARRRFESTATADTTDASTDTTAVYVGIDLGGTTVGVALVNAAGRKLASVSCNISTSNAATPLERSFTTVVDLMCTQVHKVIQLANAADAGSGSGSAVTIHTVAAFGIGAPGLLDTDQGIIQAIANFEWENVPLTNTLAQALRVDPSKVFLENDANSALLAELWTGAGKDKKDVVMLTLGTGVGCAIMSGGHLLRGCSGDAGEMGHTVLIPNGRVHGTTGVYGIFEGYASATAVVARTKERLATCTTPSPLRALGEAGMLTCKEVFRHAALLGGGTRSVAEGEGAGTGTAGAQLDCSIANTIVAETMEYIGIGCINVCRCFDPELVILTGGMTNAGDPLLEAVRRGYCKHHWNITPSNTKRIVLACGGTDAGMVGAAAAALLRHGGTF